MGIIFLPVGIRSMCANKACAVFLIRYPDLTTLVRIRTMRSILCHQSGDTYPIYRVCTSSEDVLSVNEDGRRLAPRHPSLSLSSPYDMLQAHASSCSPLSVCCQNPFRGPLKHPSVNKGSRMIHWEQPFSPVYCGESKLLSLILRNCTRYGFDKRLCHSPSW